MDASATPDAAFSLLTDYERVAAVFSNVLRSQTFRCVGAETRLQQARQFIFLLPECITFTFVLPMPNTFTFMLHLPDGTFTSVCHSHRQFPSSRRIHRDLPPPCLLFPCPASRMHWGHAAGGLPLGLMLIDRPLAKQLCSTPACIATQHPNPNGCKPATTAGVPVGVPGLLRQVPAGADSGGAAGRAAGGLQPGVFALHARLPGHLAGQ
jgi:hypothetical protein